MSRPVTITVFAGISGLDKKPLVDDIVKKSGRQDQIMNIDFDARLTRSADCEDIVAFLGIPSVRSKIGLIEGAFAKLTGEITKRSRSIDHVFLQTHLTYFRDSEALLPPLPQLLSSMNAKTPDSRMKIIVLMDDSFVVWQRLRERASHLHPGTNLKLREVVIWRSVEMSYAELIGRYVDDMPASSAEEIHSYPVSVRHPLSTFNNLIFEKDPRKVYLSYHISSTRNDPVKIGEINRFRRRIHQMGERTRSAVFDPVTIDELALKKALAEAGRTRTVQVKREHRWPLGPVRPLASEPEWPIRIPRHEVQEVLATMRNGANLVQGDIENQITSRDYHLVELANYLAVYRPVMGGSPSMGVDAEIKHAVEHGRTVIAYHPKGDSPARGGRASTHPFGNKMTVMPTRQRFEAHLERLLGRGRSL